MIQPTKLTSVTTIIPCQNLRYATCSFRRSSSGTAPRAAMSDGRRIPQSRVHRPPLLRLLTWSQPAREHGRVNVARRLPRVRVGRQVMWHGVDPIRPLLPSAAFQTHDGRASSPCPFRSCSVCREDSRLSIASVVCACGSCHCPFPCHITFAVNRAPLLARRFPRRGWVANRRNHESSDFKPVRFETRARIRGPIPSRSWNAKTTSGQPGRDRVLCEPDWRLSVQPIRYRAASTRLAFDEGQEVMPQR